MWEMAISGIYKNIFKELYINWLIQLNNLN